MFDDLHYDNTLWAYMIRAMEEWQNCDVIHWNNPVFDRLFIMGAEDWMGGVNPVVLMTFLGKPGECLPLLKRISPGF